MKFLANENFLIAGVRVLRNAGLDVAFIGEDSPFRFEGMHTVLDKDGSIRQRAIPRD